MNSGKNVDKKIEEIYQRVQAESKLLANPNDFHHSAHVEICSHVSLEGLWLEFGVYRGRSICTIASCTNETVYGFDSFKGLPEKWNDDNPLGVFSLAGVMPQAALRHGASDPGMFSTDQATDTVIWPDNVKLVKGWFDDSLPTFLESYRNQVAFLHIDSDIYSSCKTVLSLLESEIKPGTVILFDELLNYGEFKEHEIKAFAEFLIKTGYTYTPIAHKDTDYAMASFVIGEKETK